MSTYELEKYLGLPAFDNYILQSSMLGVRSWIPVPSSTPGGSTTQVQFNDSGVFGGDAGMTYDKTTDSLYVGSLATLLPGTISRSGSYISSVALTGGRTLTISRSGNYISSVTDGTKTWSYTRNGSNQITSWTVV